MSMYAVSSENCGNQPTFSDVSATLYWNRGASNSTSAYLDIRRVDNAWNQKGCFSLGHSLISINVPAPSSYTMPYYKVDYDSLYVVRMRWYSQDRWFYGSDCYFTLQPSEYIVVTIHCAFAAGPTCSIWSLLVSFLQKTFLLPFYIWFSLVTYT